MIKHCNSFSYVCPSSYNTRKKCGVAHRSNSASGHQPELLSRSAEGALCLPARGRNALPYGRRRCLRPRPSHRGPARHNTRRRNRANTYTGGRRGLTSPSNSLNQYRASGGSRSAASQTPGRPDGPSQPSRVSQPARRPASGGKPSRAEPASQQGQPASHLASAAGPAETSQPSRASGGETNQQGRTSDG